MARPFIRTNPAATTSSAGATSTAAPASSTRCARPSPTASRPTRRASPAPTSPASSEARMTSYRLPNRGRVDHAKPVRFSFDGKTTPASPATPRLGAARQRRPPDGPLVQVPPPPRRRLRRLRRAERADGHPPRPRPLRAQHPRHDPGAARRPRGDQPEPLALAPSARSTTAWARCSRPASTTRPSCGRAPSGTASTSRSSATPPASASRRRARRRPLRRRFAHTDVLIVGAGPAGLAAALAAGRSARASCSSTRRRAGRHAALRAVGRHRRQAAWDWLAHAELAQLRTSR